MIRFFHYLQLLVFPFAILAIYFIVKGSVFVYNIDDVSFGVLCMGIAFAFGSMGDINDISNKEKKVFSNKKKFKRQIYFLLITAIAIAFTTVFFILQKWIGNNGLNEQFYQLGLNCSPLIIAAFFSLKQLLDKKKYYDLNKNNM